MKSVWLLHGTGGSNKDYYWFADTKDYLEAHNYSTWWPQLPHTEKPNLVETRNFIEQHNPSWDDETIFIGHSSACPIILEFMQYMRAPIKQAILVAGFYKSLDDDGYSDLMLPKSFDWKQIKASANEIILINANDDPWGCNDRQARPVAEKLNATLVVATGQGHMGSGTFNQPYKEFPLLKRLLKV